MGNAESMIQAQYFQFPVRRQNIFLFKKIQKVGKSIFRLFATRNRKRAVHRIFSPPDLIASLLPQAELLICRKENRPIFFIQGAQGLVSCLPKGENQIFESAKEESAQQPAAGLASGLAHGGGPM